MVLRLSEHYTSVQGEGPRVGIPTQFVRFGGCNLRCPGWPCDTQHAIDPKYRNEWEKVTYNDLFDRIVLATAETGATNICLTGGEPFLQPREDLEFLCQSLDGAHYTIECFSNGTLKYPSWVVEHGLFFIMDWKLDGSGEGGVGHEVRWQNLHRLSEMEGQAVKFVLKDLQDLKEAALHYNNMREAHLIDSPWREGLGIFYGRVWDSKWTDAEMIEEVLKRKLPWRLNVQQHNYIWPPQERGR